MGRNGRLGGLGKPMGRPTCPFPRASSTSDINGHEPITDESAAYPAPFARVLLSRPPSNYIIRLCRKAKTWTDRNPTRLLHRRGLIDAPGTHLAKRSKHSHWALPCPVLTATRGCAYCSASCLNTPRLDSPSLPAYPSSLDSIVPPRLRKITATTGTTWCCPRVQLPPTATTPPPPPPLPTPR